MSFFVQINPTTYAVDNGELMGVYQTSTVEELDSFKEVITTTRVKYCNPIGSKIGEGSDALTAWRASIHRSTDQKSPESTSDFDDGDGYSRMYRWQHNCQYTGKSWYCEETEKVSGY